MSFLKSLREWLFGVQPDHGGHARRLGSELVAKLTSTGLAGLAPDQLVDLVEFLLTNSALRRPLRANTRFLQNVTSRYRRNGRLSAKQIQAIRNILERAYPHNLAAELTRYS